MPASHATVGDPRDGVRVLLIRHGQTPHNVTGALDTAAPGAELTALGRRQAAAVPVALAGKGIRAVYASPLVRTRLTAAPLAAELRLPVVVRPGLEEIGAGDLELRTDAASRHSYAETVAAWMSGDLARGIPGGPDGHDFWGRYRETMTAVVSAHDPGDTVAVFAHGAAIRAFTALATGMPPATSTGLRIANTGMSELHHDGSGWHLLRWTEDPLGGPDLRDDQARDVTGESAQESDDA